MPDYTPQTSKPVNRETVLSHFKRFLDSTLL
jgi:hypothetical protein